ncbi:MAG TPA: hypothetical protein VHL79_10465 [Ramlibacter sp.]|nr:hypothetical protein [Ramlibacter sp.]
MPVAPGSPQAGSATPVPAPPVPGWGAPGVAPPAIARPPALPPAPIIPAPSPRTIYPGPWNTQRRSLADMANEQLRRDGLRKDPLAREMEGAGRDDCLHPPTTARREGGLLALPSLAERALNDKCAR